MGVYIKGIEMPKDWGRWDLSLFVEPDGTAYIEIYPTKERLDVVSVPTPHGNLKDADKLSNWHKYTAKSRREMQAAFALAVALNDAPTVIEAEE